ncbi:MAG: ATP-binding cassette domain-containing protein [bacterium]|nr:ATP-binding cassette domain-containing protein [bacterium]
MALLTLKDVTLAHGGPPVLDGVDLRLEKGERVCLLGRNGEGKTTLLRVLAGEAPPDAGEVIRAAGLRVGLLPQEIPADLCGRAADVVAGGLPAGVEPWEIAHRVSGVLDQVGLDADAEVAEMSTGQRRRVLLARALAGEPDLLLLDEPTNHLDIPAIRWLESFLLRWRGTLLFVTHDRAFLRSLAGRILELDRGRLRDWRCDYDTFLRRRDEDLAAERRQRAEFDRVLAQEEAWIRQGVRERRTRNEGRVRRLLALREERFARRDLGAAAQIAVQDAERSGKLVLRAEGVDAGYGDRAVVRGLTTTVLRGDKVGVLGPNGAGKTTLLKVLLGELEPLAGRVRRGANLKIAYSDQQRDALDPALSVQENIASGRDHVVIDGQHVHVITYLQRFLFPPEQARAPITRLSGGERNRLLLAKLFTQPANVLVLDEPTNDLDLETLELLEELLVDFDGTVLLVSHDREFLDNVATSTLVVGHDGSVLESVGGYRDWERVEDAAAAAVAASRPAPREGSPAPRARPRPESPRRLTWKEARELEALPQRIEDLERRRDELHAGLADPALYQRAGGEVPAMRAELEAIEAELVTAYARWEELESIREAQG